MQLAKCKNNCKAMLTNGNYVFAGFVKAKHFENLIVKQFSEGRAIFIGHDQYWRQVPEAKKSPNIFKWCWHYANEKDNFHEWRAQDRKHFQRSFLMVWLQTHIHTQCIKGYLEHICTSCLF